MRIGRTSVALATGPMLALGVATAPAHKGPNAQGRSSGACRTAFV